MSDDPGETWAAWLREQFDSHPRIKLAADLVRAGGEKQNGRPVIDASSVTAWLRGRQPSFKLAVVVGEAFGVDVGEALIAAGYQAAAAELFDQPSRPRSAQDPLRQEILEHPRLSDRDKRLLLAQYDAMLGDQPQRPDPSSHQIGA